MEAFPEAWTSVEVDSGLEENFDLFPTDLVLDSCSETDSSDGVRPHIHTEFPTTLTTEHSSTTTTTLTPKPSTPTAISTTTTTTLPVCPCCDDSHTVSHLRKHVGSCFADSMPPHKPRPKRKEDDEAKSQIASISANASKLSLSQRIALLESLGRLASLSEMRKGQQRKGRSGSMDLSDEEDEESDDDVRPTEMGSDMFALSLLFSAPPAQEVVPVRQSKRRRVAQHSKYPSSPVASLPPLTINYPTNNTSPASSPASSPKHLYAYETTPVHSSLDWTSATGSKASFQSISSFALGRTQATTPPPTDTEVGFPVSGTKRKRLQPSVEVVQALSFNKSPVATFGTGMDSVAPLFGELNSSFGFDDDFNL